MDYEQFLKQVAEDLKYSIPNATIEISDVVKIQGESYICASALQILLPRQRQTVHLVPHSA